jgi:hypothetical protein
VDQETALRVLYRVSVARSFSSAGLGEPDTGQRRSETAEHAHRGVVTPHVRACPRSMLDGAEQEIARRNGALAPSLCDRQCKIEQIAGIRQM